MYQTNSIMRKATRTDSETLNILTCCTHERYEQSLAKTGHRFFALQGENIKKWNTRYAPVPENYTLMNGGELPFWVSIDLVLSQNKFGQYELLKSAASKLNCPLVTLEHTLPTPDLPVAVKKHLSSMSGDKDVFISEFSVERWGWSKNDKKVEVVHHGLDTEYFKPGNGEREDLVISVVNDWINRDWCCGFKIWQEATGWPNSTLPLNVWGDTKGLSVSADSTDHLVKEYQRSGIFLNTSLISPVPTVLLEAMACGCAIVSTDTCMIPEFIKHGENGFMGKTPQELRHYVDLLRSDKALRDRMGNQARETIVGNFNVDRFVNDWNKVFSKAVNNG